MPEQLAKREERGGEKPVANEHKNKGPLAGRKPEYFRPRVTPPPLCAPL
jgi:hypothetical protein